MTDRRLRTWPWLAALALFAALAILLGGRMAAGRDPAIGLPGADATAQAPARRVVVRRIQRRVIVTRVAGAPARPGPASAAPAPVRASAPSPAPVTRTS